jgi:hypothetical protein
MSGLDFFVIGALAGAAWRELINILIRVMSAGEEWKLFWRTLNVGWKYIKGRIEALRRSRDAQPLDQTSEGSGKHGQANEEHSEPHNVVDEGKAEPSIGSSKDISGR